MSTFKLFLHVGWFRVSLMPSVNDPGHLFCDLFSAIANRHVPVKKISQQKNAAWRKAQLCRSHADCLAFRQIRNKATQAVWKAKADYFKNKFSLCGSDPKRLLKTVRDLEHRPPTQLPLSLKEDDIWYLWYSLPLTAEVLLFVYATPVLLLYFLMLLSAIYLPIACVLNCLSLGYSCHM